MSAVCVLVAAASAREAAGGITTSEIKIAFFGDQGLSVNAQAVLELVNEEGAHAVLHLGDFDYGDDPQAWFDMIDGILGPTFPYFACAGNHDAANYYGPGGYQELLAQRMSTVGVTWQGDLGVRSSHWFGDIHFVLTAPNVFGNGDTVHAPYIRQQFKMSNAAWRISGWHVLMEAMQIGGKSDESGWEVYEASRRAGAIIATGHEHSYARTHALSSCRDQIVAVAAPVFGIYPDRATTTEDEGVTFAFHNGLGGRPIRDQERCLPDGPEPGCNGEWASIYTSTQQASHGALFGTFGFDGDPCQALFYFKDIEGNVPDAFLVRSWVGRCHACVADATGDESVDGADFQLLLASWGPCPGGCPADLDGDGFVGIADLLIMLMEWGPCQSP